MSESVSDLVRLEVRGSASFALLLSAFSVSACHSLFARAAFESQRERERESRPSELRTRDTKPCFIDLILREKRLNSFFFEESMVDLHQKPH